MRKLFTMSFAAAALLLGSCAQNEVIENPTEQKTIGFTTLNDRVTANTRAANDAKSDYGVFSVRSATSVWFMDNLKVTSTESEGVWSDSYSPTYYWPTGGATVDFYAYAPYKGETDPENITISEDPTKTGTDSKVSITYTVPDKAQEDFTVATPKTGMNYDSDTQNKGNVPFIFSHMLSKITVEAKLTQELLDADYSIAGTGDPLVPTFTTTLGVAKNTGTVDLTAEAPAFAVPTEDSSASYIGKKSYMIMPQTSTGVTLQLNGIKIMHNGQLYWGDSANGSSMATYTIANGNVTDNTFAAGKHYKITFTIGAEAGGSDGNPVFGEAITFSSTVTEWDTKDGNDVGVDQPNGN